MNEMQIEYLTEEAKNRLHLLALRCEQIIRNIENIKSDLTSSYIPQEIDWMIELSNDTKKLLEGILL